ncbi:AtzE family amidohydrolase [Leptolyngbya sp. AN03gr2]|uniref:AtzE family amidohydrolase n=1 Tax=unclassified Leptolyngbya TaxID=2650499 RepID=UPI003D3208E5
MKINQYENAVQLAEAIRRQEVTAKAIVFETLERIAALNPVLNCFTTVTDEAAIAQAEAIDRAIASGTDPGALAGVPFAVKDLFDIEGITTRAGSKINAENPPATQDAAAVAALKQAGAICVGALNMDEYAYGFSTENTHYGTTPNPHALDRVAGGSSGGSAVAVAAGLVPLTLGSDTNGSIRVPASLCGVFGFKPTYGRLSRSGAVLFSESLDHIGPFARSVQEIALAYDSLQQAGGSDPAHTDRAPEPCSPQLNQGIGGLRIAIADGYFAEGALPEAIAAVQQVAKALNVTRTVSLPESHRARAAALTITACEGAQRHLHNLRTRPQDFDPRTRDRFLSGAFLPASWYIQAQQFRQWYRDQVRQIFQDVDLILAPATPYYAPLIEQNLIEINGAKLPSRPNLGRFTQPLSFIGLPILSVPVSQSGTLPIGVQLVAAPYRESVILRVAAALEANRVVKATIATVKEF